MKKNSCLWSNQKINLKFTQKSLKSSLFDLTSLNFRQSQAAQSQKISPNKILNPTFNKSILRQRQKAMQKVKQFKQSHHIYTKEGLERLIHFKKQNKRKNQQKKLYRSQTALKSLRTNVILNQISNYNDLKRILSQSKKLAIQQPNKFNSFNNFKTQLSLRQSKMKIM